MISDAELLKLVMDRYREQPTSFVIDQFVTLKAGLIQANNKLALVGMEELATESTLAIDENSPEAEAPTLKKKYTKRNLVLKPEEAIGEEQVQCCLCGRAFQNLTANHLLSHDITVEEYKKLCGYAPEQKLIAAKLLARRKKTCRGHSVRGKRKGQGSTSTK